MTPNELEIVRLAVAGRGGELARRFRHITDERLLAVLHEHQLAGFAHDRLKACGELQALPAALVQRLDAFGAKQRTVGQQHIERIATLRNQLDAAGVDIIFLKGPFLSQQLYGDPLARLYWDIDVLLRDSSHLREADALLHEYGWKRRSSLAAGLPLISHFTHNAEYAIPKERHAKLDVHWTLGNHISFRLDVARLWDTHEHATLDDASYPVLSREYVLVTLVLGVINDVQRGRARLKSLLDLARALARFDDTLSWEEFFVTREREGMLHVTLAACEMALRALPLDDELSALRALLAAHRADDLVPTDFTPLLGISKRSIAHKRWTFGLYRGGRVLASLWWAASLPVKHSVFREDVAARPKHRERNRA
jgi:hypothetical protein